MKKKLFGGSCVTFMALFAAFSLLASEEDLQYSQISKPGVSGDFMAAFDRLKSLEGTWDEAPWSVGEDGRVVQYRLTGRGSALIEEYVGDPPMTTVYHLDGDNLRLTHYCNAGNQPRMTAAFYRNDTLKFDFVDVTNLSEPGAYHTRTLEIKFHDENHIDLNFVGLKNGNDVPGLVSLTRRNTHLLQSE